MSDITAFFIMFMLFIVYVVLILLKILGVLSLSWLGLIFSPILIVVISIIFIAGVIYLMGY